MSSKITLSENQIQDIIRLYTQNRETSREIGKKYNVSNTYILELLKKNNIKPIDRRCLKSFDLKKDIIPLYFINLLNLYKCSVSLADKDNSNAYLDFLLGFNGLEDI